MTFFWDRFIVINNKLKEFEKQRNYRLIVTENYRLVRDKQLKVMKMGLDISVSDKQLTTAL
ncbi:hypothetical protein AO203_08585 [Lactobacillus gallinarum]|nr:hypothetical protein AO203_08585 [Lactobacillus gallinarum]